MNLICVTNMFILSLIQNLTISDASKILLKQILLRYDDSYVNFVYTLFTEYLKPYIRIISQESYLTENERREIINTYTTKLYRVNENDIFIIDKFDLLFSLSSGNINSSKFSSYLYEDVYDRIENIVGVERASEFMEEIFESIEYIICNIECSIYRLINNKVEEKETAYFFLHIDIIEDRLYLAVC